MPSKIAAPSGAGKLILTVLLMTAAAASMAGIIIAPGAVNAPGVDPQSFYAKDSAQGVYVRDSAVALEKFAHGQRMERQGQWDTAADLYQEIMEKYKDRVVPSRKDAKTDTINQYMSVAYAVQEQLARWPEPGLNVYRSRYEATARAMLDAAGRDDPGALNQVFWLYFVTDSAKGAGMRLMDLRLEAGEFAAAAWIGERLLAWHPGLIAERPEVMFRTAAAQHASGNLERARHWTDQLKAQYPKAKGVVAGQDVLLVEALEQQLRTPVLAAMGTSDSSWPIFGGSPSRDVISSAQGRPGSRMWSIELSRPSFKGPRDQREALRKQEEQFRAAGMTFGVMPVVDQGELFFQDGVKVYAVSLESGVPLPGWAQTYSGERGGAYSTNGQAIASGQQLNVTVTEDSVLAIMGGPDRMAALRGEVQSPDRQSRLVCLDRVSGRERWTRSPRQLPDELAPMRDMSFTGAPLVVEDRVFVVGRGAKGAQFEDCYLLAYDRRTGEMIWTCYIASANTGFAQWGGMIPTGTDGVAHVSYASGRLYVLTNLGAVAAVDAYRGTIVWLSIYPREAPSPNVNNPFGMRVRAANARNSADRPWAFNPPIVRDGKLFVLPSDGKHVLIYDAGSGIEIKRINRADLSNHDTLLAVLDERMITAGEKSVSGDQQVMCIDWTKYDPVRFRRDDSSVIQWICRIGPAVRGRGFVTRDSVFIPAEDRLFLANLRNGKIEQTYPRYPRTWGEGEGPGNVLATSAHVVVAGPQRVDVYTDMEMARAKLDAEVAATPDDPQPRLRYAEVMFVAGEPKLAIEKLDEAINLIGGRSAMREGAARDRVFNDALTFAQKLSASPTPATMDLIDGLFDRAAKSASAASQEVDYRVSQAKFARKKRDYSTEARLYQQILSSPAMRLVALADSEGRGGRQAAAVAEEAIAGLLRVRPEAYAPFELAATKAVELASAGPNPDPRKLLAIAQEYPNARVAPRAMLEAAGLFERSADPRMATQVLRQVYGRYADSVDRAAVIEAQARNYLALPDRVDVAIARLGQGAKIVPMPRLKADLKLPDGAIATAGSGFDEALLMVRRYSGQAIARRLPDLGIPVPGRDSVPGAAGDRRVRPKPFSPAGPNDQIAGIDALVPALPGHERADRLVAYGADDGLVVFPAGATRRIMSSNVFAEPPRGCAWIGSDSAILLTWSKDRLAAFSAQSQQPLWPPFDLSAIKNIEVVGGGDSNEDDAPEATAVINNDEELFNEGGGAVIIRGNRRLIVRNGRIEAGLRLLAPPQIPGAEQLIHVRIAGDRIILATSTGRLLAVDAASGAVAWQTRLVNAPIERLEATDDFIVVRLVDDYAVQLVAIDTFSGQYVNRWSFNNNAGAVPLNFVLAPDGTLVYTLPDRLCGRDLYETGRAVRFETSLGQAAPYNGGTGEDQLLVGEGRILSLSDNGQFIRVNLLENGQPLAKPLATGANDWKTRLRRVGSWLYVVSPRTFKAYNLEKPAESWNPTEGSTRRLRDVFFGVDYLVAVDQPLARKAAPEPGDISSSSVLLAFGRYSATPDPEAQSGRLDYMVPITDRAGIVAWQPASGGIYYLAGDRTLHFLRGSLTGEAKP